MQISLAAGADGRDSMETSHYATLGLARAEFTEAALKKQYRLLALKWHPDRNRGNEEAAAEKFKELHMAFSILSDPEQRAEYDSELALERYRRKAAAPQPRRNAPRRPPPADEATSPGTDTPQRSGRGPFASPPGGWPPGAEQPGEQGSQPRRNAPRSPPPADEATSAPTDTSQRPRRGPFASPPGAGGGTGRDGGRGGGGGTGGTESDACGGGGSGPSHSADDDSGWHDEGVGWPDMEAALAESERLAREEAAHREQAAQREERELRAAVEQVRQAEQAEAEEIEAAVRLVELAMQRERAEFEAALRAVAGADGAAGGAPGTHTLPVATPTLPVATPVPPPVARPRHSREQLEQEANDAAFAAALQREERSAMERSAMERSAVRESQRQHSSPTPHVVESDSVLRERRRERGMGGDRAFPDPPDEYPGEHGRAIGRELPPPGEAGASRAAMQKQLSLLMEMGFHAEVAGPLCDGVTPLEALVEQLSVQGEARKGSERGARRKSWLHLGRRNSAEAP